MTGEAVAVRVLAHQLGRQAESLSRQRLNLLTASVNVIVHLPAPQLASFAQDSASLGAQLEAFTTCLHGIAGALVDYADALDGGDRRVVAAARSRLLALTRAQISLWTPAAAADGAEIRSRIRAERHLAPSATTAPADSWCDRDVRTADVDLAVASD